MHIAKSLLFGLILALPGALVAQQQQPLQLPADADVRIIVDISGSMKQNDPNNLRQPAVRLLARMIPTGSTAGVWTFGQWVNMLVKHGNVDDDWRESAVNLSRDINSVALRTNLGEAIKVASDPYLSGKDLSDTDFILLTDGKVDLSDTPSVNEQARQRILGPLLSDLVERGATVHTVALSDEADVQLLELLASETGGHFSLASSAEELNRSFLRALNAAAPQEQIPLDEEGFSVDAGVEEFTALIFWGENETSSTRTLDLIAPDGSLSSKAISANNMRWAAETGYDLITVTDPLPGQWRMNGELGEGSRVTVVSDLRMVVSPVPVTFSEEAPIDLSVAFFEDQARIDDPDFLNVLRVELRLTSSDGRSGSKILSSGTPPEDGVYTDRISNLPAAGNYEIEVVADGKTFSRRFSGVTRFVVPKVSPALSEPSGPIDISQVETPEPPEVDESPEPDEVPDVPLAPNAEAGEAKITPIWTWVAGAVGAVAVCFGGLFAWLRRRSGARSNAPADVAAEPPLETSNEGDESPDEETDIPVIEDSVPEAEEEQIPELEPEQPEAGDDSESAEERDEPEDDEFGLEDFDLSEFDELPDDAASQQSDDSVKAGKAGSDGPKKGDR